MWMVGWVDSVGSNEGVSAVRADGRAGRQESRDVEQRSKDDSETSPNVPGQKASDCHAEGGGDDTEVLARYGDGSRQWRWEVWWLFWDLVPCILGCVSRS